MTDAPFLDRWARRKSDALKEAEPEQPLVAPEEAAAVDDDAAPAEPLPDIESLGPDSDYTVFMRKGVPEDLQRLALRKLWRSNPVFANLDGMNDYDENFSLLYKAGAAIQSLYQVGKGMPGLEREMETESAEGEDLEGDDKDKPALATPSTEEKPVAHVAPQHRQYADNDGEEDDV